ncbi:PKD domain-containing protein [Nocardioides sp. cx-173]|uniref:PKD domain-containing protein n=1 Tax=Nocardioides sp. cx-173 TaxID=2898796 RepID=UPI001E294333|nr:PKD domain-containing protein [Nocardioides sp. cx-173]MCD4527480.1 PKD domain-containing protein [Nocardioides sp. cx-173]UGB40335.1 PKD domain-containing protein [Nocardioides sp. cx-173]
MTLTALDRRGSRRPGLRVRLLAAGLASALGTAGLGGLVGPAGADWSPQDPTDPATPTTVTADALPTVQIDGVVWSQAIGGDVVYAGGDFENARPAGSGVEANVPRANLVAYDVATGEMTDFAPTFNQQIRAVAVAGDRLYVGGEFTSVDGEPRGRLAAFDLTTGDLVEGFAPQVNGAVQALTVTDDAVYVGGAFGGVGNQDRGNLAAFDLDGELLAWAPTVGGGAVTAITANPDGSSVAVGGTFLTVNGDPGQDDVPGAAEPGDGLALLDATTGAARPLPAGLHVYNGNGEADADGGITSLAADSEAFYGAGYTFSSIDAGTIEGVFAVSWDDGSLKWVADCHGDSYSVHPQGDLVYAANHSHYCENIGGVTQGAGGVGDYPYYRAVAFGKQATGTVTWEPDGRRYYNFEGQPAPSLQTWFPSINVGTFTGQSQGSWSVTGNEDYVVMGGEFTRVNGQEQQGLVRFARADLAPKQEGPTLFADAYPLKVASTEPRKVRISWASNRDIDNGYLEYRLSRRLPGATAATLVHSRRVRANFWNPLGMTFTDAGVTPGDYEYRLQARDAGGLTANSPWTPVTVSSSGAESDYLEAVHGDEPTHWWRFGEPAGSADPGADSVGFNPLTVGTGVARGTSGAVPSDSTNLGATFTGVGAASLATSTVQDSPPDQMTVEAWFRTTSTAGGRIVGRDTAGARGAKVDRLLYLDAAGHVSFGVKPNATLATLASPATYNDGGWHHAAGVLSPAGMQLYVDGELSGANPDVTVGEHLALGYWRVGGGSAVAGLPGDLAGSIDEVAVYKRALAPAEIAEHVAAAGHGTATPNVAPTASFTQSTTALAAAFTSTSTDTDGTIGSYLWQFGDGTTASEASPSHVYANAGTYEVTLTVIDDDGGQSTVTASVSVTDPTNAAPTAAFALLAPLEVGLRPRFDASTSTDADGTVTGWSWDFGNGRTSTQAAGRGDYRTSGPGTYLVTLTVTDNDGAMHKVARNVTVSEAAVPVLSAPVNAPPTPSFQASPRGLTVDFTSTATDTDGTIDTYLWQFGDGTTAREANPSHAYADAGTYEVALTVTDDAGAQGTTTGTVTVTGPNQPPRASFQASSRGLTVDFMSTSTDPDGTISNVTWSFGDGRVATGTAARHAYAKAGRYSVGMTVTDDGGTSQSTTRVVTVNRAVSRTSLTVSKRVRQGRPVRLAMTVRPALALPVTGTVRVFDKGRAIRTLRLVGAKPGPRTLRVALRGMSVGTHRLRVVYSGSTTVSGSTSGVVVVRVVRRR